VAASLDSAALALELCPPPEPWDELAAARGEDEVWDEAAAAGSLVEPVAGAEDEALLRATAVAFADMGRTALMDEIEAMDETLLICIVRPPR
jgi:hypothetical protein